MKGIRLDSPDHTAADKQGIMVPRPEDFQPWEACMTINDTWAYRPKDRNFKSSDTLIYSLVEIISRGGNFLLDVGPQPDGRIQEEFVELSLIHICSHNLYESGSTTATTVTVNNVPTYGVEVYARLWWEIDAAWKSADYTYTEAGAPVSPVLTTPAPGSVLPGLSLIHIWNLRLHTRLGDGADRRFAHALGHPDPDRRHRLHHGDENRFADR